MQMPCLGRSLLNGVQADLLHDIPMSKHPREARAAAQEVVSAIDDEALAEANLHAPVPQRPLVCYDDI